MAEEIIWQSTVTAGLVAGLSADAVAAMVRDLDDAVADIVESYTSYTAGE